MNWVLLLVIAIIAVFGYTGWKRGVVSTVVSLAVMIVTILVTTFLAPIAVNSIKKNTTLFDTFQESVYKTISKNEKINSAVDSTVEETAQELPEEVLSGDDTVYSAYDDTLSGYIGDIVEKLGLPDNLSSQVENIVPDNMDGLFTDSVTGVKNAVVKVMSYQIASILFNIIAYAVIFLVVYIAMRIVASVAGIVTMLPGIKQVNKLAGLGLGLVEGLIIVWIFFAAVTIMAAQPWAAAILKDIGSSSILEFLYDNDFILKSVFEGMQ